jgi:hypothetical protein
LKVWCSRPARAALRYAGKGTKLAELPIGHKIASASPYNVAQLYAVLGESIRNGKNEPCFDGAMRRHRLIDVIARASQTGQRQLLA